MNEIIKVNCKLCGSPHTKKYGFINGNQRYYCLDCKRKFKPDDSLFGGRVPASDISSSLSEYYSGMSVNDIRSRLKQEKGYYPSPATVYQWIDKFTDKAVDHYSQYQPKVGDTWIADESVLDIDGKDVWFWDVIDADTRFLLASKMSYTRKIEDAVTLFELAYKRAGKAPKTILTDKLRVYPEAIAQVFGGDAGHKRSSPFVREDSTRLIERFHGTLKDRTKVMRGLRDTNSALAFTDGFIAYYNFIRPHESLDCRTPAEAAGIDYKVKNWASLIRMNEPMGEPQYIIPPEMKAARAEVRGKPYKAGRKRKPKVIPSMPQATITRIKL